MMISQNLLVRVRFVPLLVVALICACGGSDITGLGANPVHSVLITVDVPGQCLFSCDPPGVGLTLTLVHVHNTGQATAYLQTCGQQVAYGEQVFANDADEWVNVGPAITCPNGSGPLALAAGDSVQINAFYADGKRRVTLEVASKQDMSDQALDTSAAFVIPPK